MCATLPIELVFFDAHRVQPDVEIKWSTSAEINTDRFEIERSLEGEKWTVIHQEKAAGNSNELNLYSTIDRQSPKELLYYRLVEFDQDGARYVHTIKKVSPLKGVEKPHVSVNHTDFGIVVYAKKGLSELRLIDKSGRVISSWEPNGEKSIEFSPEGIMAGLYIVTGVSNGEYFSERVFIR